MKYLFVILRFCMTFCMLGVFALATAQEPKTFAVGGMQVEILIDETMEGDTSILQGASEEMLQKYIPTGMYSMAVTSALIRDGEHITLIDTGLGKKLAQHLQERNTLPENIFTILITHMHFDHINGLMHEGKAFFPNAKIYISEPELAYWTNNENINNFPEEQREAVAGSFKNAQNVLNAYQGRVVTFLPGEIAKGGEVLLPGVQTLAAYGHTPGHTIFLLENQGEKLMVVGDLWHMGVIQFPLPDVTVVYDVDPEQAAQSRKAIFAYAAGESIPVAGMHQANPEFGLIKPDPQEEGGYMLEPLQ